MTIQVRFTVKEKVDQEKRTPEDVAKGIVKFLVDVFDETRLRLASARNAGETVAIATILTITEARSERTDPTVHLHRRPSHRTCW